VRFQFSKISDGDAAGDPEKFTYNVTTIRNGKWSAAHFVTLCLPEVY